MFIYIYTYICICIHIHVCVYIHLHTHEYIYISYIHIVIFSSQPTRKSPWNPAGVEPVHLKPADIDPGSLIVEQIQIDI